MVKSSLITFLFQAAALLLGLLPRMLLASMLLDQGLGMFEIFRFIPTFLHAVSNLGLNNSLVNFIGRKRLSEADASAIALSGGLLICGVTLIVTTILFLIIRFIFWGRDLIDLPNAFIILGVVSYVPYMIWNMNLAIHLGRNKIVDYNVIWIIQPFVAFIGYLIIWLVIPKDASIEEKSGWVYLSFSFGIVVSVLAGMIILARDGLLRWSYPKGALWENIKFGIQSHIGSLVGFLGLRMNIPFLAIMMDISAVGIYGISMAIGEAFKRVFSSISTALLPVASSAEGERAENLINIVLRVTIFASVIILGLFALICKPLIDIAFPERFSASVGPTYVVLIWVMFTSLSKVFQSDAVGRGKPIWVTYTTVLTFVVLFVLSWVLIPAMSVMGAAWASTWSSIAGFIYWVWIYMTKTKGFSLSQAIIIRPSDISRIVKRLRSK